jgi:hypothetical protein
MSKKVILVMAVAGLFAMVGSVLASPPVTGPKEGFLIDTTTDIQCIGTVIESERFDWTYADGGAVNGTLGTTGDHAQVVYQQDYEGVDGTTSFNKTFTADSSSLASGNPNLNVDKIITYQALVPNDGVNTPLGTSTHSERVGLNIVSAGGSYGGLGGLLSLCPFNSQGTFPATNEGIAAGSDFTADTMQAVNSTEVFSTSTPTLTYDTTMNGTGEASAAFIVELQEGLTAQANAPNNNATIISDTVYQEEATARSIPGLGPFSFVKNMTYQTDFPGTSASATPFERLLR